MQMQPDDDLQGDGKSRVADNWKPAAEILDSETGKTVVSLKLTTNDEDTALAMLVGMAARVG